MLADRLERVLSCRDLPTLPAVALNVLAMARQPDIGLPAIAAAIEQDASLAAKVLRTVNSSFFGLKTPCSSITRAIGFLGLNAVKALVLGFGLVELTRKMPARPGFDHATYWKRTIIGASAAKELAAFTRVNPDEAMTAGLFSDIGMLAMVVALDAEYLPCLGDGAQPHESLPERETAHLGFTHAQCGAGLTKRWAFPPEIAQAIEWSHDAEGVALAQTDLIRTVALGAMVADLLSRPPGASGGELLIARSRDWFQLTHQQVSECLERIGAKAAELARMFEKDLGSLDVLSVLAAANDQLLDAQLSVVRERESLRGDNERLTTASLLDPLTQIGNRRHFDDQAPRLFARTREQGVPISVLFLDADRFKGINDALGHAAGDAVLRELAARLAATVGDRGVCCRYGGEEFAVLLPATGREEALAVAERVRAAIADVPFALSAVPGCPPSLVVTASIGVASTTHAGDCSSVERLVHGADSAVYDAKEAGRNRVVAGDLERRGRPMAPPAAAARPANRAAGATPAQPLSLAPATRLSPLTVLLVEDDPLAARLLQAMLQREIGATVVWVTDAESAISLVRGSRPGDPLAIDAVVTDMRLPKSGGLDVARAVRHSAAMASAPCVVISASEDGETAAREAGASAFFSKSQICRDAASWTRALIPVRTRLSA